MSTEVIVAACGLVGTLGAATIAAVASRSAKKAATEVDRKLQTNGTKQEAGQLLEAIYILLKEHIRTPNAHDFKREEKHP
jgi:hypothetical protein